MREKCRKPFFFLHAQCIEANGPAWQSGKLHFLEGELSNCSFHDMFLFKRNSGVQKRAVMNSKYNLLILHHYLIWENCILYMKINQSQSDFQKQSVSGLILHQDHKKYMEAILYSCPMLPWYHMTIQRAFTQCRKQMILTQFGSSKNCTILPNIFFIIC